MNHYQKGAALERKIGSILSTLGWSVHIAQRKAVFFRRKLRLVGNDILANDIVVKKKGSQPAFFQVTYAKGVSEKFKEFTENGWTGRDRCWLLRYIPGRTSKVAIDAVARGRRKLLPGTWQVYTVDKRCLYENVSEQLLPEVIKSLLK